MGVRSACMLAAICAIGMACGAEEEDLEDHPGPADRTIYGGWAEGPQLKATGRFRAERHKGRWWFADPEGRLFWSFGPGCVNAPAADTNRTHAANGFVTFANLTHRRLRSWGANTIAGGSDARICLMDRTPYVESVVVKSRVLEGACADGGMCRDPFDDSFVRATARALRVRGRAVHDPWCVGFSIDDGMEWGTNDTSLAHWVLASPVDQPARQAFVKRLQARNLAPDRVPEGELRAFTRDLAERYFRLVREAVKSVDEDLPYLGCRFAGVPQEWTMRVCAQYADAVTWTIGRDSPEAWKVMPSDLGKPILLGGFSCDARMVKDCVLAVLRCPYVAGMHWFPYSDSSRLGQSEAVRSQNGWTDANGMPHSEMVNALRDVTADLYACRLADVSSATSMPRAVESRLTGVKPEADRNAPTSSLLPK